MDVKDHWDEVYSTRSPTEVSWYQRDPKMSLDLIAGASVPASSVLDVGGGASTLVDGLLSLGYSDLTILDIAGAALDAARSRLGTSASKVRWISGNVLTQPFPAQSFDVWHDRAVFHFLTSASDRRAYIDQVVHAVRPHGVVIVATFAEDGPTKCSGLEVCRYSPGQLHQEFGSRFTLKASRLEDHLTPGGKHQHFQYCLCEVMPDLAKAA